MIKYWLLIICLACMVQWGCSDAPQIVFNQVPVTINLSATASDFEQLEIDFQKIKINSQFNLIDTSSTSFAGIFDMTDWVTDKKMVGEFLVSYDSIQRIEFFIGDNNSLAINGQNHNLPLKDGLNPSIIIPVGQYIQDKSEVVLNLELNSNSSVLEESADNYVLDPKLILKN